MPPWAAPPGDASSSVSPRMPHASAPARDAGPGAAGAAEAEDVGSVGGRLLRGLGVMGSGSLASIARESGEDAAGGVMPSLGVFGFGGFEGQRVFGGFPSIFQVWGGVGVG